MEMITIKSKPLHESEEKVGKTRSRTKEPSNDCKLIAKLR